MDFVDIIKVLGIRGIKIDFLNKIMVLGFIGIKVDFVNEINFLGIIGIKVVFVNEKKVRVQEYNWDYRDYWINSFDQAGEYATKIVIGLLLG